MPLATADSNETASAHTPPQPTLALTSFAQASLARANLSVRLRAPSDKIVVRELSQTTVARASADPRRTWFRRNRDCERCNREQPPRVCPSLREGRLNEVKESVGEGVADEVTP
ncbi:hypothetical protein [Haladaptatus litoreus]|uniref:hypothetical protein n=1 Tax=Haladaptatus litoreus TaxID=553468 RepID=UPI0011156C46|nr:hypothetical protein [Haladaptatus litoreus]